MQRLGQVQPVSLLPLLLLPLTYQAIAAVAAAITASAAVLCWRTYSSRSS